MIRDELTTRKQYLARLMESLKKKQKKAPVGTLRISGSNGCTQYYYREKSSDRLGVYIPKKNKKLITGLAQKNYNERVISAIQQEIKAIEMYIKLYPSVAPEDIYMDFQKNRRDLITPVWETDDMYRTRWEAVEYSGKSFTFEDAEYVTGKGERVRSKSEIIIADTLAKAGVPYRYECPVYLEQIGTVYPDFTVLNLRLRKEFYWEHLGIMDDAEYADKAVRKIASYQSDGVYPGEQLLLTMETRTTPLNVRQINEIIEHYLL